MEQGMASGFQAAATGATTQLVTPTLSFANLLPISTPLPLTGASATKTATTTTTTAAPSTRAAARKPPVVDEDDDYEAD